MLIALSNRWMTEKYVVQKPIRSHFLYPSLVQCKTSRHFKCSLPPFSSEFIWKKYQGEMIKPVLEEGSRFIIRRQQQSWEPSFSTLINLSTSGLRDIEEKKAFKLFIDYVSVFSGLPAVMSYFYLIRYVILDGDSSNMFFLKRTSIGSFSILVIYLQSWFPGICWIMHLSLLLG